MARGADTEAERLAVQAKLDGERTQDDKNRLGQFATPPALARDIVSVALPYLARDSVHLLEPAIGTGAFYSALRAEGTVSSALGCEIDPRFAEAARRLWGPRGLRVLEGDFTELRPPPDHRRASLVLANPPYVRHHHLGRERKLLLRARAEAIVGRKVSGLSGLYVYFMILAHAWMAPDAVAAWLVPGEWMDVNYGTALKDYLSGKVTLLRVHRFDAADVQFSDALVSSSVVFYRNTSPALGAECEMTSGALREPARTVRACTHELRLAPKWSPYFRTNALAAATAARWTLGDLVHVKRGIATGGNELFVRPRTEFRSMGIPERFLRPILPSSKHLVGNVIEARADGYPDVASPPALLDCPLAETDVKRRYPRLWRYLESPLGRQVRKRYLTSGRTPWYAQERRPAAPVVATYMGRGRKGQRPFRFFWNRSAAIATNVYLLLIPKEPLASLLRREPERAAEIARFLASRDTRVLVGHGRVYGGGLFKLEPKELAALDAAELVETLGLAQRFNRECLRTRSRSPS